MAIVSGKNIHLAFGGAPIFDGLDFKIEQGERLCIVGRNGAGKSSFLKILSGRIACDEGELHFRKDLKISLMEQDFPDSPDENCYQVISSGIGPSVKILNDYFDLMERMERGEEISEFGEQQESLQKQIEEQQLWSLDQKIQKVASMLNLDLKEKFSALSGGRKRRVSLAKALVSEPELLLLDEPTNHIDLETVLWLENFLAGWRGTLVFISHDRSFISGLASRILEIDRGQASSWPGDFNTYVEKKQSALETEIKQNSQFDKKLEQEEQWIRQGIKARRTRNEGRVKALELLREQRKARRDVQERANFKISSADKSSKIVIEANNLEFAFGGQSPILDDFSTLVLRGDKVGIIGPNGIGKTTLVNILLGKIKCKKGKIKIADNLEIAYFDQLREKLEDDKSIIDNVVEGSEFLDLGGRKIHIISYLKDFLFSPERLNTPLKALSGGERNRVLLAKLFSRPSNFLVMDEPTNDLDIETLELLEEKLVEYAGTLLLISHDRAFLNNVVTSTLVFERTGVHEYVGGYDDWVRQRPDDELLTPFRKGVEKVGSTGGKGKKEKPAASAEKADADTGNQLEVKKKPVKLSYKEQRELEQLPKKIELLEQEIESLQQALSSPESYQGENADLIGQQSDRLKQAEAELEQAFDRWSDLEES